MILIYMSAVMRVHMDNLDRSPSEIANLWAEQNKYIDLLESILRESEKTTRQEQTLMTKLIRKNQELYNFTRSRLSWQK